MTIALYIFLALVLIGLVVFIHGIHNAQEVDPNEPFIYGDYDPSKDPSKEDNIIIHKCE